MHEIAYQFPDNASRLLFKALVQYRLILMLIFLL